MKKTAFTALMSVAAIGNLCLPVAAKTYRAPEIRFENVAVEQHDDEVSVSMSIDAATLRPGRNREYTLTPVLYNADRTDSVCFEPVTVAGRNLYILHERQGDINMLRIYRAGRVGNIDITRRGTTPQWIDSARLDVAVDVRNCCDMTRLPNVPVGTCEIPVFRPVIDPGEPELRNKDLVPKTREITGRAYINFPVNRTELYPDYMNNPAELRKIIATIDSVRNDKDLTVDSIFIKGYASPEGSYANNERLARGRTATLKDYVENMYAFPHGFIRTAYDPEDWGGLREWVEASNMPARNEILAIIDSDLAPDPKNTAIQRRFPREYAMLLATVYPELRHSDYSIYFTIRTFTNPEEIIRLTRTAPGKLSEDEVAFAISTLVPGTPQYYDLYETAARIFPANQDFCLGAANAAIARGDYRGAEMYLDRAGHSARAVYTRAVIAAMQHDYLTARSLYELAERMGSPYAAEALRKLAEAGDGKLRIVLQNPADQKIETENVSE